jgi:hypothetical protein
MLSWNLISYTNLHSFSKQSHDLQPSVHNNSQDIIILHHPRTMDVPASVRIPLVPRDGSFLHYSQQEQQLASPPAETPPPSEPPASRSIIHQTTRATTFGTQQEAPRSVKPNDKHLVCELIGDVKL